MGNSPFCENHIGETWPNLSRAPMLPASEQSSAMCFAQGQQLNVHSEVTHVHLEQVPKSQPVGPELYVEASWLYMVK